MNVIKDKALDIFITLVSLTVSSLLSPFINFENEVISHSLIILIFFSIFLIFKYIKTFFNPFCVVIDFKNLKSSIKSRESTLILREGPKGIYVSTPENNRSVEVLTTLKFQNTISRYLLGKIISRNELYLNFYTESELLKLSTDKVLAVINENNKKALMIDITNATNTLANSHFSELEYKKNDLIILEYIGQGLSSPEEVNIHVSIFTEEWISKIDMIIFKLFYDISITNHHRIYITLE